jgi:GR25 family glycosyltransferase involved in LPS biosynthesis
MSSWTIESIPSFCITLERRNDRWKRFQDQSGIDSLDLKRFLGVDGKTIDLKTDQRVTTLTKRNIHTKSRRSHEELDSIGGVGCALSHIAVWQWLVDSNHDMVLVFEDDAVVPPNFVTRANQCIQESTILKDPKKWDLWLLGGIWDDLTKIPGEETAFRIGSYVLFHAYVITKRAARMFLKDVYPIHAHIDIWVSIYSYLNDVRIVGCKKLMLRQNDKVKTDIQSDNGCKICNVPTDYDKKYSLVPKTKWQIAQSVEVLSLFLVGFIIYQNFIRKS